VIELCKLNVELDNEVYKLKQQLDKQARECNLNTRYNGLAMQGFIYKILEGLYQPKIEYNKV
jgi:hypothetical protein